MFKDILKIDENEMEDLIRTADVEDFGNESVYLCGYTRSYVAIDDDGEKTEETEYCMHSSVAPSDESFEDVQHNMYLCLLEKIIAQWDYDQIIVDKCNCRVRKICKNECAEYYDFFVSSEIPKDLVKKILDNTSN